MHYHILVLDGGYLCVDPRQDSKKGVVAFSDIISCTKFVIVPRDIDPGANSQNDSNGVGSKQEYFKLLSQLIETEVAIMDTKSKKYLGLGARKASKTDDIFSSEFNNEAQYFRLGRTDTGAYTLCEDSKKRLFSNKQEMFLHRSSKTVSQEMNSAATGKIKSINICPITVSSKIGDESNTNEWVIEPDIILGQRENCHHGFIIILGIVDNSTIYWCHIISTMLLRHGGHKRNVKLFCTL